jgi:hypothetical protein
MPGPAARLTVTVKAPSTSHEVQWAKVETWLQSAGKPNEQGLKTRLRQLLRRRPSALQPAATDR